MLEQGARVGLFVAGLWLVGSTLLSGIRLFVVPRGDPVLLARLVFSATNQLFRLRAKRMTSYERRDALMALYAPLSLLLLPIASMMLVLAGYTLMFRAIGVPSWYESFFLSGSSLLTLGFAPVDNLGEMVLSFSEATIGLGLVALLIAYLPTMYSAFARRETAVTMLEVRAGSPPSAVELIERSNRIMELRSLDELWVSWEIWFVELEESHTSLAALNFFRSPQSDRSWVTAAGTILDAAALYHSTVDVPRHPQTALCIRAGFIALRRIADFFGVAYDPDPRPGDPISISREEFDAAYDDLASQGVPLRPDRDQAWRDFAGWRVNYDTVLLALAAITMAPVAPWVSDRSLRTRPPRFDLLHPRRDG